jgi:TIR domain-containing protein
MRTVAFFSYARHDDGATNGLLSRIRLKFETEVRAFAGDDELEIFQDTDDIEPGDIWEQKLRDAIDESAFFIPVLTPYYFNRPACRRELEAWLTNYRTPNLRRRILPMDFVPLTRRSGNGSPKDPLRVELDKLQHVNISKFRGYASVRGHLAAEISRLAQQISAMID